MENLVSASTEIVSFSNSRSNPESLALLKPSSFRNPRIVDGGFFKDAHITCIGSFGSEFEILRYAKRRRLSSFFEKFDLIIVVTGVLQFAHVLPRTKVPVIILCATRLNWERKSQYMFMSLRKKIFLKLQVPILALQERKVLNSDATFLVLNLRMSNWIKMNSGKKPVMWYPGVATKTTSIEEPILEHRNCYMISVGRLNDSRKGWERLFLAYKLAFDENSRIPELRVIGDGNLTLESNSVLHQMGERYPIKVFKNQSNAERDKHLQGASFFLQTSHEEGLGLAAIEALSFGIPLICSETDGSKEYLFHKENGISVPQGEDFTHNFKNAILESQNVNREQLSKNAKLVFESRFSREISENQFLKIMGTVLRN